MSYADDVLKDYMIGLGVTPTPGPVPHREHDLVYLTDEQLQVQLARRARARDLLGPWLAVYGQPKGLPEITMAFKSAIKQAGKITDDEAHALCGALGIRQAAASSFIRDHAFERVIGK